MRGSNSILTGIKDDLGRLESTSKFAKFRSFVNRPNMIFEYEQRFDRALALFKVCGKSHLLP